MALFKSVRLIDPTSNQINTLLQPILALPFMPLPPFADFLHIGGRDHRQLKVLKHVELWRRYDSKEYAGIPCRAAPSNDFTLRREAVASTLNRMVDGEPGFLLSPTCTMLRKGFAGGYAYKRVQVVGDERYRDAPDKNAYSHPHDALQYLLSGGGEARVVMRREERKANPHLPQPESKYDVFRH